ncbi:MAG: U32 family peptidase [Bacteroidales bacterium]|nr:U32 family peptidase [Bacteroidales bacterium]
MRLLELLSPAKNREQGMAAISHGADAVYVGAPLFGARANASNSLEDIERLARYAHQYRAKVYATVNTVLFDNELEEARKMIVRLSETGIDALIVQDLGILEMDLPPLELHASTQMHNLDAKHVRFLEEVGFKRIILPRELSLEQIREMRQATTAELEAFVQGALCVCYSGQCYMSQYLTGGSGNRGSCSQPCRSSYDLYNEDGDLLEKKRHLLSLKDFSAAQHIEAMTEAGVVSFKIEGRLKDLSYVKNVTAYYRQLIDNMMEKHPDWQAASSGKCKFFFVPDLERTYNRGFTDYFLKERQPMASLATQKSLGKKVGIVKKIANGSVVLDSSEQLAAGDGLCYFGQNGDLKGMQVNRATCNVFVPNHLDEDVAEGTQLWRNNDYAFEKLLQGKTSERKIAVDMVLTETCDGLYLQVTDEDGNNAVAEMTCQGEVARNAEKAKEQLTRQISKLGDTPFVINSLSLPENPLFRSASLLNEMRRTATNGLVEKRLKAYHPMRVHTTKPASSPKYPLPTVDYHANVVNKMAEKFYNHHGASVMEYGVDQTHDYVGKALMTTKYCLRYELGQCLKMKNNAAVAPKYRKGLLLRNNQRLFRLRFDCERCEMQIFLELEQHHYDGHQDKQNSK